jgi:hypothetical protein
MIGTLVAGKSVGIFYSFSVPAITSEFFKPLNKFSLFRETGSLSGDGVSAFLTGGLDHSTSDSTKPFRERDFR